MTVNPSPQPTRRGPRIGSVQERQAGLPEPLRALHRRLLAGFLAGPPKPGAVADMAAELGLDPNQALGVLAATDLVHTDPVSGRPVTVRAHHGAWRWEPATTVVLVATTAVGACGAIADCCPHISFHADPQHAQTYLQTYPGMSGELLDQADAVETARRSFGGLLDPAAAQAMGDNDTTR